MRRATLAALLLVVATAGCGSGGAHSEPRRAEAKHDEAAGEEAEREEAARGLPAADRVAYYQVATAVGDLRRRAALVSLRRRGARQADAVVRSKIPRLRRLRPSDPALRRLRDRTLAAARRALASRRRGADARRAARRQLTTADRLSASLDDLVHSDPRFSALVPD